MAKEQTDSERKAKLAENRKASGEAAKKQLRIPAKKNREDANQAAARSVRKPAE